MKILLIMDPGILVPPVGYGGIERLVEMFAIEYKRLGHEVHLLVTPGSYVEGCIVHPFGKEGFPPKKKDARRAIPLAWRFLWNHRNDFDLVHSFGRLAYLLPIMSHPVKKIMTYQREIDGRNIRWVNRLRCNNMFFTACSKDLLSRIEGNGNWAVVYNAVSFDKYSLSELVPETAPLIFLGRIERIKGCHTAIQLAKRTNNNLVIAGNISTLPKEIDYFENEIKPFIDGKQIIYVGALNDEQKNKYLGASKALVFPIEWNEPFGIVMIEAMACGTPVIAFNKGSVTEVIDEGITGFKVDSFDQMEEAVKKLDTINRATCRARAKSRFDAPLIALQYLDKVHKNSKKIVIVTTGQPAANPRALKEYQALKEAGYRVKMIYSYSLEWSYKIDEEKFSKGTLEREDFVEVGGNPGSTRSRYFMSRLGYKIFQAIQGMKMPFIKDMVTARSSFSLWLSASRFPADLYIAHYPGALPAARKAAKKHKARLIFDAEDFHRGETPEHRYHIPQAIYIENRFLPSVDLMTVASPLIGNAYQRIFPGVKIVTVDNVFSKSFLNKRLRASEHELKLFWFSQHIGPFRGLELVVEALNYLPGLPITLHLLGNCLHKEYIESLFSTSENPQRIHLMPAVAPEEIFEIAAQFDVGLAAEIPDYENRNFCLTNKIFTYLMAGNCILASNTAAQVDFMKRHEGIGLIYRHDDALHLAEQIKCLFEHRDLLESHKSHALDLAANSLNWEEVSKNLIAEIDSLLNDDLRSPFDHNVIDHRPSHILASSSIPRYTKENDASSI